MVRLLPAARKLGGGYGDQKRRLRRTVELFGDDAGGHLAPARVLYAQGRYDEYARETRWTLGFARRWKRELAEVETLLAGFEQRAPLPRPIRRSSSAGTSTEVGVSWGVHAPAPAASPGFAYRGLRALGPLGLRAGWRDRTRPPLARGGDAGGRGNLAGPQAGRRGDVFGVRHGRGGGGDRRRGGRGEVGRRARA